jgi:hypothetical protein
LFERFVKGDVSIKALARERIVLRGRQLYPSLIHQILRKRIYTSDFDFDGIAYKGTHEPLVSRETWERVQAILDGRTSGKSRQTKRQFTLTGLIHCGRCGCLMVGELKKSRYVYYHCTGSRGRCGDPYVREERLLQDIAGGLKQLVVAQPTLSWLKRTVTESDQTERGAREQALKQLKAERDRLQARIEMMYLDRLDGRITAEFFDAQSKQWRDQQKEVEMRTKQLETTALMTATEAVEIMRSLSDSCRTFAVQESQRQRALAAALMQHATWKAGKFEMALMEPYQILAHSNSVSQSKEREKPGSGQEIENWLPGVGSNHDNLKERRICKLQGFQWSRMPDWTRKTRTRTQLVHGRNRTRRPVTGSRMSDRGELWGSCHRAKSPWQSGSFWGKCFLFNVAIKEARPCSAQAQNTLSSGSGERLSSLRMVTNSASSLSRLMISPTRFRLTPSLLRTPLYSERISSVTSHVNVPTSIQSRINGSARVLHHPPGFESGYSGDKYRRVDYTSRLFSSAAQS